MINKTHKYWQKNVEEILSTQSLERRISDENRVSNILGMLRSLPTGALIVDWEEKNNVKILMDYQCEDLGGYHILGSNHACLNAHLPDIRIVPMLAHELRHVWQDHNNLIPGLYKDVDEYIKQIRFIEADATAYTVQICHEMLELGIDLPLNTYQKTAIDMVTGQDKMLAGFCVWFDDGNIRNTYDSGCIRTAEVLHRIVKPSRKPDTKEFGAKLDYDVPEIRGLNVKEYDEFLKIGEMFGGGNYLKHIPTNLLTQEEFIGNISSYNKTRISSLQKQGTEIKTYHKIPVNI